MSTQRMAHMTQDCLLLLACLLLLMKLLVFHKRFHWQPVQHFCRSKLKTLLPQLTPSGTNALQSVQVDFVFLSISS
eukprot:s2156_g13.t1